MGLPQPLVDALRDFEKAEAANQARQALDRRLDDVRAIEENLGRLRECSNAVQLTMEQKIAEGGSMEELDELIDSLLETEEEFRREFLPHVEAARQQKVRAFSRSDLGTADKALSVSLSDRWIRAILGCLEVLRDLRWNLMAFRGEIEDPGDAPVFDNPQDLLSYLKIQSK